MSQSKVLYLAYPIDFVEGTPLEDTIQWVADRANRSGWAVYRPGMAWKVTGDVPVGKFIEEVNREVLKRTDAMIALLPSQYRSVGVPREIEWAKANGVPVLVCTDKLSWAIADVEVTDRFDPREITAWLMSAHPGQKALRSLVFDRLSDDAVLPSRAHAGDAGYDLYASENVVVPPGGFVDVPTGIRAALPAGVYARITGRSSTWRVKRLVCLEGIIDTGYRGELFAGVMNPGGEAIEVNKGDRVAQLVLHRNTSADTPVTDTRVGRIDFDSIPGDTRGSAGFGSTGA